MGLDGNTDAVTSGAWHEAQAALADSREDLAAAAPGFACQAAYARLIAAQSRCTTLVHKWLAEAMQLERVAEPRRILSLDVDGVLEEQNEDGFSATGITGAAALRLMQLGGVAVLINTGRSLVAVQDRVEQFALLGGVASFGGAIWDEVYGRHFCLISGRSQEQVSTLRQLLRSEPALVEDPSHVESIRVSRIQDGGIEPIGGPEARAILDRHGFTDLAFWVAPTHTDFVDRRVDKGTSLIRLRDELGLNNLPLAAIGDGSCDVQTLRGATHAFIPAATLPAYLPSRRQRLIRSRYLGEQALWDTACRLVPDASLRRRVRLAAEDVAFPEWFPGKLRRQPPPGGFRFRRLRMPTSSING